MTGLLIQARMKIAIVVATSAMLILPALASAEQHAAGSRSSTNHDIWVQPGETAGDLECINCSVHVRGQVAGDVATVHGNVSVEPGAAIGGDVAAFLGDINVEHDARIGGDVAVFGGRIRRDPQGQIGGDQAAFGRPLAILIGLVPLVFVGLIIALIVWLIQRSSRPVAHPA